jgi:protein O-GlcNAc transferase
MLQQAVALHQRGRLAEAEPLYRAILKTTPDQFDALHMLGVIECQRRRFAAAVQLITRALMVNSQSATAHANLGVALTGSGRHEEALASYDRALALRPDYVNALNHRGNVLNRLGCREEALVSHDRALAFRPDFVEALSDRANTLNGLGRHGEALASCNRALELKPDFADALSNRAVALNGLGRHAEALANCDRALELKPDSVETLANRASILNRLGRHLDALANCSRALALRPDFAEALNNRGNSYNHLGRYAEALRSCDRALALRPDYAEALNNRGVALAGLMRREEAVASYDRALALKPDNAEALSNRGIALSGLGRDADAVDSFDRAVALQPDYVDALNNRGVALSRLKRHEEALVSCDRALALKPNDAEAWNNRAIMLTWLRREDEALQSCDRALALKPDFAEAFVSRGNALNGLMRPDEAAASFDRALALKPQSAETLNNRGNTLMLLGRYEEAARDFERLLKLDAHHDEARGKLLLLQMQCCDWGGFDAAAARIVADVQAGRRSAQPLEFLAISQSPADQLRCAQMWARDACPPAAAPLWQGERYHHERIRVAYLSSDLREHAVAHLIAGLFERHDRQRFETIAVSFGPDRPGAMRTRLEAAFERFIDVRGKSDDDVASMLRAMEVDIAVDLNGFTTHARTGILALRPAPVQVNYLGYPGTMGADFIDYILADRRIIPEGDAPHYTEKIVYLPDSYLVTDDRLRIAEATPARAMVGLPEAGTVFCSFNNNFKITPPMFDVWMRLLHRVAGSVLWLRAGSPAAERNLRREAEARGVAPERLVFAPLVALEDHLARHRCADLFLDTLPYNAHTTASDALWAGLPLVTCLGETFAGRVAASLLDAVGLPELVTRSLEDYEALAFALATDAARLAALKAKLAQNRMTHPLFDTDRFRRHLESAYETMWQRHQRGTPPEGFAVAPIVTR